MDLQGTLGRRSEQGAVPKTGKANSSKCSELFYGSGDRSLAVDIETEPGLRSEAPRELSRGRYDLRPTATSTTTSRPTESISR